MSWFWNLVVSIKGSSFEVISLHGLCDDIQVNDTDVSGLSRPEVVQLLRNAKESVTLVISRQEVVEEQEEEEVCMSVSWLTSY